MRSGKWLLGLLAGLLLWAPREAGAETIGFECPALGALDRLMLDPFVDCVYGVTFTAEPSGFGDEVVGLVKDNATSACIEPPSENQLLGTGRDDEGPIGLSGFPIRATFPVSMSISAIALAFQTLEGSTVHVRVYDDAGVEIASGSELAEPAAGDCGLGGGPRALKTIFVPVNPTLCTSYVIMDVDGPAVFVIESFTWVPGTKALADAAGGCGATPNRKATWGRLKTLYR